MTIGTLSDSIVVPPQAIFAELESSYVWTVTKDNTLARANVVLGLEYEDVRIVTGIDVGTTVLVEGNPYLFAEGAKVDPTLMTIDAFNKKEAKAMDAAAKSSSQKPTNEAASSKNS